MTEISRRALFGKLNPLAFRTIESATMFCKLRGHDQVELAHWLHQILQLQDSDLQRILRRFSLESAQLTSDLTHALEQMSPSARGISDLSSDVEEAVERGWVYATLMFGESQVRTGHLLVGILRTRHLRRALRHISPEFDKLKPEALADEFPAIVAGSPEDGLTASDGFRLGDDSGAQAGAGAGVPGRQQALKQFTVDLTEQAREGKIDPIVGRDDEIRQVVDILMRRRQNNPMLVGEAGVGKTAVAEGLALRIAAGDVPPPLQQVRLCLLDVGLLQAGASMKGEFEQRLRHVIDDVQSSPKPVVLFIDEAHALVGAGGAAGTGDAANLLKPALARGTLRTIGATTWAEYKRHIEKDPALTRRFQTVQIGEPSEAKAISMLRGLASAMERHHQVQILDEALEAAVRLSHRYIPARQLPDKAIGLLDTACARAAISQHAVPAAVDDARKLIQALETEREIIQREKNLGVDTTVREAEVSGKLAAEGRRLAVLEHDWRAEQTLVEEILDLRGRLRACGETSIDPAEPHAEPAGHSPSQESLASPECRPKLPTRAETLSRLKVLQQQLLDLQGELPLILANVDYQAVASVVADWTGIPVGRMARDEVKTVLGLASLLGRRVVGQDHAMEMIARRVQTSRAGLDNPQKPVGVFLLAGTSGVGKTETALALAETLYGGEQNLITINMSEYQEAHTVSSLKGAPPGYVGYGEGGVLTEAVRRRPYSVVLLDEVEKAHPDVHELFFQVFDKGVMEDGEGRRIDFRNTLILLTTNIGTSLIEKLCQDPELMPDPAGMANALREPLLKAFPPALLGRLVAIPYYPLSEAMLERIVRLQLDRIKARIENRYRTSFHYDQDVVRLVVGRCTESESGGRMIDAILTNSMLPRISCEFLSRLTSGEEMGAVRVGVRQGDFSYVFQSEDLCPGQADDLAGAALADIHQGRAD